MKSCFMITPPPPKKKLLPLFAIIMQNMKDKFASFSLNENPFIERVKHLTRPKTLPQIKQ